MRDLSAARDGWDYAARVEEGRLQHLTLQEGIAELLALYREFGPELDKTETVFRESRLLAMRELQERLRRLGPPHPSSDI